MKKFALSFLILTTLFLVCCEKNNDVSEPVSVIGTWQSYQFGLDSNKNNVPDGNELKLVTDTRYITFNPDNTFRVASSSGISDGNYTYINDTITCVYPSIGSFQLYVHSITKDIMMGKESSVEGMWFVDKRKQ